MGVTNGISNAIRESLVDRGPDGKLPSLDTGVGDVSEVAGNVVDVSLTLLIVPDFSPERAGLLKVELSDLAQIPPGATDKGLVAGKTGGIVNGGIKSAFLADVGQGMDAALVVGAAALGNERRRTIALEVGDGDDGLVDWQLLVVDAQTVTVSVRVREEAGLEDRVGRSLDVRDEVRRREGGLFDFCEIVLWVLVENELANGAERELFVGPDLGEIEDVPAEVLSLLRCHGLDVDRPGGVVARFDGVEEGLDTILRVFSSEFGRCGIVESLETSIGTKVNLSVDETAVVLEPLERVSGVAVLLMVAIRSSTIREKDHDLMNRFWVLGEIVPEHISISQMALGMPLLSVDEVRELGGVTDEEDGSVVEDPVPVALICPEFDGKATRIASGIGGSRLATDGGEADGSADAFADLLEERLRGDVAQGVSDLEVAVGTGAFSMDDTLWNTLSVKVSEEVDVVKVLKEKGTIYACALGGIGF